MDILECFINDIKMDIFPKKNSKNRFAVGALDNNIEFKLQRCPDTSRTISSTDELYLILNLPFEIEFIRCEECPAIVSFAGVRTKQGWQSLLHIDNTLRLWQQKSFDQRLPNPHKCGIFFSFLTKKHTVPLYFVLR